MTWTRYCSFLCRALERDTVTELRELTRELVSIPSHEDETAAGDAVDAG
ncbi:hypothetical protein [Halostella sp. PRR32]|nr:hypothetical protein [Halostella sp. PRR32]